MSRDELCYTITRELRLPTEPLTPEQQAALDAALVRLQARIDEDMERAFHGGMLRVEWLRVEAARRHFRSQASYKILNLEGCAS